MDREQALPFVSFGVDNALSFRRADEAPAKAVLVGWQCGFEPMFVAVWSCLSEDGSGIDAEEAIDLATDALEERQWFDDGPSTPDYVILG